MDLYWLPYPIAGIAILVLFVMDWEKRRKYTLQAMENRLFMLEMEVGKISRSLAPKNAVKESPGREEMVPKAVAKRLPETPPVPPAEKHTELHPAPPSLPAKTYSEKASKAEMEFAGYYLNIAGIIFLTLGVIIFLRMSLLAGLSKGLLQSCGGLAAGVLLLCLGESFFRRNMQKYAHPLAAGGFCILFLTIASAHFRFHLIDQWLLFLAMSLVVAWSGLSIFRYDSKLIGNLMLAVLFFSPFVLKFTFSDVNTIISYLVAINVGTAYVAYHKKWDYYLIATFLGTYALFFYHFRFQYPVQTLIFLVITYALFLVSNNLLHFARKSHGNYNIVLSFINPTVFASTSYLVLLKMPNILAVSAYLAIGAVHLCLTRAARRMEERDSAFFQIAVNNLVLGILFITASVSFITYFSSSTTYFSLVTALWFVEAFVLLHFGFRLKEYEAILLRYSYFCMSLASAQLAFVIPTLPETGIRALSEKLLVNAASIAVYFGYFLTLYKHRAAPGAEERFAMVSSVLGSFIVTGYLVFQNIGLTTAFVAASSLALIMFYLGIVFQNILGGFRNLAKALVLLVTIGVIFCDFEPLPILFNLRFPVLLLVSILVGFCGILTRKYSSVLPTGEKNDHIPITYLVSAIIMKTTLLESTNYVTTLIWSLAGLGVLAYGYRVSEKHSSVPLAQTVLFLAFLKSISFDTSFVTATGKGARVALTTWGSLTSGELLCVIAIICTFLLAARTVKSSPDLRNFFLSIGLILFTAQSAYILYNYYGILDYFQVILSAFWSASAFLYIAYGIFRENKILRQFGLAILVSSVLKICIVDIWVLNAYNKMTTFLIIGSLLTIVSFFYQKHRERIAEIPIV